MSICVSSFVGVTVRVKGEGWGEGRGWGRP